MSTAKERGCRNISVPKETDEIEDFDKLTAVLRSPAGRAVIDAINKYTSGIWHRGGECAEVDTPEGGFYMITIYWNVFCRHGKIKGNLRKAVKNLLFQSGELEQITFVQGTGRKGIRDIVKIHFIHVVEKLSRLKSGGLLVQKETEVIEMFRLRISKPIWSHLAQKGIILAGKHTKEHTEDHNE